MCEQRHVTVRGQRPLDHPVGPRPDVVDGLAARRAVLPDRPTGHALADLGRGQALVLAVVDLDEALVDLEAVAEPGELGGDPRALQR